MSAAHATVRRARLPAAPAARRTLERWLADLDVRRWGLPAAAIVVVRRAHAPLAALASPAARDPLADTVRAAARPAHSGVVGAACNVVWFADEAELLACLAQDALAGALGERWWWALLLGPGVSESTAVQHWVETPRAVPQALVRLAPAVALGWLERLGAAGRSFLVAALARVFPVPPAVQEMVLGRGDAPALLGSSADHAHGRGDIASAPLPAASGRSPEAPRVETSFEPPRPALRLLRMCAALAAGPERVFAATFGAECLATAPSLLGAEPPATALPILPPAPDPARSVDDSHSASSAARADPLAPANSSPPGATVPPAAPVPGSAAAPPVHDADQIHAPGPAPAREGVAPPLRAMPSLRRPPPAVAFDTRFGGVFFLLNVATALGLYGDFTQPLHRGLPWSPWQFLLAAARTAIGRDVRADPLAGWLRSRIMRVESLPRPSQWRVDPAWRAAFAGDRRPRHAVIDEQGLRLLHPAGFALAWQAGGDEHTLPRLAEELGDTTAAVVIHRRTGRRCASPDLWSLSWPLVRARLAAALGLPPQPALALAFGLPARVHADGLRVDAHFALAALPLVLRLAGLDRDPGWLPAAGCDIRFHFD